MRKKQQEEDLAIRKQMTDDPEQCMDLLLKWRGMKYTDLGDAIDRDPKTISRTVKGETTPKVETAALIVFDASSSLYQLQTDGGSALPIESGQSGTSVDQ